MGVVTKRCAVCTTEVSPATIFCSQRCKEVGRLVRDSQAGIDEDFTLAEPLEIEDDTLDPLAHQLSVAGEHHRMSLTVVLAAFTQAELQLDALIWAAHSRGLTNRQIGAALEMRTSSVRRRVLAFQARMHGPAPSKQAVPA